jgi:hypothetical protein
MSVRLYRYVGSEEIRRRALAGGEPDRACIQQPHDLRRWMTRAEPTASRRAYLPATFIIDPDQQLWIADRRSEHVACAAGGEVLAAGELAFCEHRGRVEVVEASNLSTGYCPEPECWSVVAEALDRIGLPRPSAFTSAFEFRRCERCDATNLVKEEVFECAVCQAELSRAWNFDPVSPKLRSKRPE